MQNLKVALIISKYQLHSCSHAFLTVVAVIVSEETKHEN